jgi:hypothetical protein
MEAWSSGRVGAFWHLKDREGRLAFNREADKHKERTDRDVR